MRIFLSLSAIFTLSWFGIPVTAWGGLSTPQSPENWELVLKDEKLTAHINGIPLKLVLERLQKTTNIYTVINGNMEDGLVKVDFENLPLEKGLQKLLQGHKFILTFGDYTNPKGPWKHKVEALHVYPPPPSPILAIPNQPNPSLATSQIKRGQYERETNLGFSHEDQAERLQSQEPNLVDMTDEEIKELAAESKDPNLRLEALEELLDRERVADSLPLLQDSLRNTDALIRQKALDLLANIEPAPIGLIGNVAQFDPSPDLRREALEHLTDALDFGENLQFTVATLQNIALGDKNVEVRLEAMEILVDHVEDAQSNPTQVTLLEQILKQALNDPNKEIREEAKDLLEAL